MGKYTKKFDAKLQNKRNVTNVMLCDILNEVAEANRLKRIELENKMKVDFEDPI